MTDPAVRSPQEPLLPSQMVEVVERLVEVRAMEKALGDRFIAGLYREILDPSRRSLREAPSALSESEQERVAEVRGRVAADHVGSIYEEESYFRDAAEFLLDLVSRPSSPEDIK